MKLLHLSVLLETCCNPSLQSGNRRSWDHHHVCYNTPPPKKKELNPLEVPATAIGVGALFQMGEKKKKNLESFWQSSNLPVRFVQYLKWMITYREVVVVLLLLLLVHPWSLSVSLCLSHSLWNMSNTNSPLTATSLTTNKRKKERKPPKKNTKESQKYGLVRRCNGLRLHFRLLLSN